MWSKLSFIAYLASLTLLLMMLFRFNPLGFGNFNTLSILGVSSFGLLGFTFSILSNFFDLAKKNQKNKTQGFIFHIGMIIVFFGIITHLMHWPFTLYLFIGGLILIAVSFFVNHEKKDQNEDLLDG
ncbi:MAG TPA: hypothetical protein VKX29_02140 [Brumimicrobium sp.]|nr:hypothetical protein [Brumimicrobium sp.]